MDELLLHPQAATQLKQFAATPSHALIITGQVGAGKLTVAEEIAKQLLDVSSPLKQSSYYKIISPIQNTLTIEQVRQLQDFLKLKTAGKRTIRRVVIIENAHYLTTEAQNALLKILEEPPTDTVLILTCVGEHSLLPTIYSRCQSIKLTPVSFEQTVLYFKDVNTSEQSLRQAYALSRGLPALLIALIHEVTDHPMTSHIAMAKSLLKMTKFDRLCTITELSGSKDDLPNLLQAFQRIAHAAIGGTKTVVEVKKWQQIASHVYEAEQALYANGQPKLVLTDLFLHI